MIQRKLQLFGPARVGSDAGDVPRFRSQRTMALLGWSIYVTNVPETALDLSAVKQVYGLRWRVECVFKTWKSNLNFTHFHDVSHDQLRLIIRCRLIAVTLLHSVLFAPLARMAAKRTGRHLSLLKLVRFLQVCLPVAAIGPVRGATPGPFLEIVARQCTYESRKRRHFGSKLDRLLGDGTQYAAGLA